jgi:serine/threonine protein kinase
MSSLAFRNQKISNWKKFKNYIKNFKNRNVIPVDELPNLDTELRKSNLIRRSYEKLRPLRYAVKLDFRYDKEFMYDFMPIGLDNFIGRGSYKFVYKLPWNEVVKIGKPVLASDPIFGSLYFKIAREPHKYLSNNEMHLMEHMEDRYFLKKNKEKIRRKFYRLALEKLHYNIVKSYIPDLVIPTQFFMGVQFREMLFSKKSVPVYMPADVQPYLPGRHLKEFAKSATRVKQPALLNYIRPKWTINFQAYRFGNIKKKTIKKMKTGLQKLILLCQHLANHDKLIIDLHSENLIITLPDFELRIFDFHLFDVHLYEPEERGLNPEKDHIELIEQFLESLDVIG